MVRCVPIQPERPSGRSPCSWDFLIANASHFVAARRRISRPFAPWERRARHSSPLPGRRGRNRPRRTALGESEGSSCRGPRCPRSPKRSRTSISYGEDRPGGIRGPGRAGRRGRWRVGPRRDPSTAAEARRISPAPALRPGSVEAVRRSSLARRGAAALVLLLLALCASLARAVNGFPLFGFAAVGLVVGALGLASPLLVRWAAAAFRPAARLAGAPGRLATRFFGGSLARNGLSVTALAMALG